MPFATRDSAESFFLFPPSPRQRSAPSLADSDKTLAVGDASRESQPQALLCTATLGESLGNPRRCYGIAIDCAPSAATDRTRSAAMQSHEVSNSETTCENVLYCYQGAQHVRPLRARLTAAVDWTQRPSNTAA